MTFRFHASAVFPFLALGLLAGTVGGCHSRGTETAPVSGVVTLRHQPVADVLVSFQPSTKGKAASPTGLGSVGITDAQGRFQLKLVARDQMGAVVGRHVVRLTAKELRQESPDMATPTIKNPLPPQSLNGSLSFEVPPGGTDQANFDLE